MSPLDIKKLKMNILQDVKPRKNLKRHYPKVVKAIIVPFSDFVPGRGRHHLGKKMECKWCHRTFKPDGRPLFACDQHWLKELWWRASRDNTIKQEWIDHLDKIEEMQNELQKKEQ